MTTEDETKAAVGVVTRFLRLMEDRDLVAASRCLAPGVDMVFPGDRHFGDLEALVESARKRYRNLTKNIESVEAVRDGDTSVVYVMGRLSGVSTNDVVFENVRFIDRLVIKGGLITDHRVWNDLAESGLLVDQAVIKESSV